MSLNVAGAGGALAAGVAYIDACVFSAAGVRGATKTASSLIFGNWFISEASKELVAMDEIVSDAQNPNCLALTELLRVEDNIEAESNQMKVYSDDLDFCGYNNETMINFHMSQYYEK